MQSHWSGSEHLLESQEDVKDLFQDVVQDVLAEPGRVSMNWLQLTNWKTKIRVNYTIALILFVVPYVLSLQIHLLDSGPLSDDRFLDRFQEGQQEGGLQLNLPQGAMNSEMG